jgi:hypothetical protein
MTEPVEPMRAASIGKHRLDDPEASTVAVPPEVAVDLTLHPSTVGLRFTVRSTDEEGDLPLDRSLGVP